MRLSLLVSGRHPCNRQPTSTLFECRRTPPRLTFLNRQADYLETIAQLRETLTDDGRSLEKSSLSPDDFIETVYKLEDRINEAFRRLADRLTAITCSSPRSRTNCTLR